MAQYLAVDTESGLRYENATLPGIEQLFKINPGKRFHVYRATGADGVEQDYLGVWPQKDGLLDAVGSYFRSHAGGYAAAASFGAGVAALAANRRLLGLLGLASSAFFLARDYRKWKNSGSTDNSHDDFLFEG